MTGYYPDMIILLTRKFPNKVVGNKYHSFLDYPEFVIFTTCDKVYYVD
jgi:hypothetical protein